MLGIGTNVANNKPLRAISWVNIAENNNETNVKSKSVPFLNSREH